MRFSATAMLHYTNISRCPKRPGKNASMRHPSPLQCLQILTKFLLMLECGSSICAALRQCALSAGMPVITLSPGDDNHHHYHGMVPMACACGPACSPTGWFTETV